MTYPGRDLAGDQQFKHPHRSSTVVGLPSLQKPEPEQFPGLINFTEAIDEFTKTHEYVQNNTNRFVSEREYSKVMNMASDPDKAIEIFNDPDYPQKFFDKTGMLPEGKSPEEYPKLLKQLSDNYSYIKENTHREFTADEYSLVMGLSKGDPIKAIEIIDDPDFPQRFFYYTGSRVSLADPYMIPKLVEQLSDNYDYIKENTNYEFTADEYSLVLRMSDNDPIKAVGLFILYYDGYRISLAHPRNYHFYEHPELYIPIIGMLIAFFGTAIFIYNFKKGRHIF